MRIGIYESSTGSGPHVAQLTRGLLSLGHHVEPFRRETRYDLVLVHCQVAHRTDYVYPHFPPDGQPIAFFDFAEYGPHTRLPDRAHRFANSFTQDAMSHDTKDRHQQIRLKSFLDGKSYPYFLREMSKCLTYPANYHPIDYPLYHLSVEPMRPNREEYLSRGLDLFCWWGMSHPWRVNITEALRACHVKAEIGDRWGDENKPQVDYFERMRAAKCTVSYDGYGSGSFRMTEALVRTVLLQGPLSIVTRAPLVDGETCVSYNVSNQGEQFCGTDIGEKLDRILSDAEEAYGLYERGYDHCMTHLTERATAQYVLDTVAAHDWSMETALDV